jgi:hypothetical protein
MCFLNIKIQSLNVFDYLILHVNFINLKIKKSVIQIKSLTFY